MRRTAVALAVLAALVLGASGAAASAQAGTGSTTSSSSPLGLVMDLLFPPKEPPPAPRPYTAPPTERYALIIGITQYPSVANTVGGANDARLVRDVLLRHGWRDDRIVMLTDSQATGQGIRSGLDWLQRVSNDRSFSLLHYSGHVKRSGGSEHLWPYDNRYIADSEVVRAMQGVRGASWTSMSGCHAEGLVEGLASPRHLVTVSSRTAQKSYEDPRTTYSVWTGMLFDEGIRQRGADANGDGVVSIGEAFTWASPRAHHYTQNQRPYGPQQPFWDGDKRPLRLDAPRV